MSTLGKLDAHTRVRLEHAGMIIRDKESFAYAVEITRDWGCLQAVLDWCKSELVEDWRWQLAGMSGVDPGRYIFYFDSERDCLAFTLKWR